MNIHHFKIPVNCCLSNQTTATDKVQDFYKEYLDDGVLILPKSYTTDGKATRLVITCHGAGGTVTTDDAQIIPKPLTKYLVANGYAVMDVNGLPEEYAKLQGIDLRNNIGSPIAIRSYVKAYFYCVNNFNLQREVFVHGASMGGISSTNLVLSGQIPVIAHSAFCPVLDTFNEIFTHPWSDGLPKYAMSKIYDFDKDANGEFVYDENKLAGFNPVNNAKAKYYPVPVKFWHCIDDPVVNYQVTEKFIKTLKDNGLPAYLRPFSYGGHEPQSVGEPVESPCGIYIFEGEKLQIKPAVEELFIWIKNFDY